MEKEKSNLAQSITKLWKEKKYDEVSKRILQTNVFDIRSLIKHIELDLISKPALAHILESLSMDEWSLCKGLDIIIHKENDTIITILQKKYQTEFEVVDLETKIKMFAEIKTDYNKELDKDLQKRSMEFMEKNWQHLVHLIRDLETGLEIYETLFIYEQKNLWSTVAALKTIKVVCKNKNVAETVDLYSVLAESFKSELSDPIRVQLAEIILQKMEQ
jgi:hypothetical protein